MSRKPGTSKAAAAAAAESQINAAKQAQEAAEGAASELRERVRAFETKCAALEAKCAALEAAGDAARALSEATLDASGANLAVAEALAAELEARTVEAKASAELRSELLALRAKTTSTARAAGLRQRYDEIAAQLAREHELRTRESRRCEDLEASLARVEKARSAAERRATGLETQQSRDAESRRDHKLALERSFRQLVERQDDAKTRAAVARDAADALSTRIENLGAALAAHGHLQDAETAYAQAANLRGLVFGAAHAEQASGLRQLAAHCQDKHDLHAALGYLERSCAEYSSSLREREGLPRDHHQPIAPQEVNS